MDISKLSNKYSIRRLNENDLDIIYKVYSGNSLYYEHFPPFVTNESILEDMKIWPHNSLEANKYYVGFFDNNELVCVMDLVINYPNSLFCYIGMFIVNINYQGKGIGTSIINNVSNYLKELGYKYIRLAYVKSNPQSKNFWHKNKFLPTGYETKVNGIDVIELELTL